VRTNREFLRGLLSDADVRAGRLDTGLIERTRFAYAEPSDAVFAIAALAQEQASNAQTPWQRYRGWRIGEPRPSRYRLRSGDVETDVFVAGTALAVGDREPVRAHLSRDGATVRLLLGDEATIASILEADGRIWIATERATFDLTARSREQQLADHRAGIDRAGGVAAPDVRTPMPGTVVAVAANTGETVAQGQLLVTIEAMKMEHKLLASTAGVVTIDVSPGDLVALDQVVARISPHEGAAA
jgi:acetyl-CoA/propionyl-CoA carboxylase biotin carboxyl carrier protein